MRLTVPAAAVLDAGGPAGTILIQSGASTDVLGTIVSGSSVDFIYNPSGTPPNLSGATITPAPTVTSDATIVRCGGPGQCDRDGSVEVGEQCDDGDPCTDPSASRRTRALGGAAWAIA